MDSQTNHLCQLDEKEYCRVGSFKQGIYSLTFPTLILEAIGCFKILSFIEKEPGVFVERTTSTIASVLLGYLCTLGLYSLFLLGASLTILAQNHYLVIFRNFDPWEISWILFCATIICIFSCIVGILFYNSSNPLYLGLYIGGLILACILFIATIWPSAAFSQQLESNFNKTVSNAIGKYGIFKFKWAGSSLNDIQTYFKCCGLSNHSDWLFTPFYLTNLAWPDSCCEFRYKQVSCGDTFALIYQNQGCYQKLYSHTRRVTNTLLIVSSIGLFLIFMGCFIVILLFKIPKRKKY